MIPIPHPDDPEDKGKSFSSDDKGYDSEGGEREAFDEYADAAGIADDKRDDAYEALTNMIRICFSHLEKEEDSHDEEGD